MFVRITRALIVSSLLMLFACMALATDPAATAAESEAYCKTTATKEATSPNVIIAKVEAGCKLLEKEGLAALPKFCGKDSEFIFNGTYIWIHTLADVTMIQHPIKYKMNGNKYQNLRDKKGKKFFQVMNEVVVAEGSGWVDYYWPKPGTSEIIHKVSYVRGCKLPDGTEIVLGCGLYNADKKAMASMTIH
ncbi:MAG: hypothetical protein GY835_13215 [bacterium]|nr:hypothetical protein [bacterium]